MDETPDTRQKIIEAALKLFRENGYKATPTRAIAAEAGVNEVTLFRHFGSKQNLFRACMESFNAAGVAGTFEAALTGDYAADIRMLARRMAEAAHANRDLMRLLVCDAQHLPELNAMMLEGARQNTERLAAYFRRQIEAGVVREDLSPYALVHALDSLFSSALFAHMMFEESFTPQLAWDTLIDQMVALFVEGTRR
ncbi:MAG: TetR/AcrR family transcriptional regulator [Anaerolineae bacterium]